MKKLLTLVTGLGFLLPVLVLAADDSVPRTTKEELKAKI